MKLSELTQHLWKASDIMRGAIDSGEYKQYIFALLFYRRLCDVWREDYNKKNAEKRFQIPSHAMWGPDPQGKLQTLRTHKANLGQQINRSLTAIENANPLLKGIFQDVNFGNSQRFSNALLGQLLDHFEKYPLGRKDVSPHLLGDAYEYLIKQFADDAGTKGGEFYTPAEVVRLIVEILDPQPNTTVYDPTCGSGGMLLETVSHLRRHGHDETTLRLYGQEKNINTWSICRIALFLHEIDNATIQLGDTILSPKLLHENRLQQFDMVIANPPFSLKKWGYESWKKQGDPYNRHKYGLPPKGYGDFAFVTHMLESLKPNGKMGVVLPNGILFRGGAEYHIRKAIVDADVIDTIVSLGVNLFYGASIPACIIFVNKNKPSHKKGKILLVNAEKEFVSGTAQNHLGPKNIEKIVAAVNNHEDVPYFARIVSKKDISEQDYNLNVIRYVKNTPPPPPIDVSQVYQEIQHLRSKLHSKEQQLAMLMTELGYE